MGDSDGSEFRAQDIPAPDAPWDAIWAFALTFNGYRHWGSFEKCAEIANEERDATLIDLRTCLFFERQRWHTAKSLVTNPDNIYAASCPRFEIEQRRLTPNWPVEGVSIRFGPNQSVNLTLDRILSTPV